MAIPVSITESDTAYGPAPLFAVRLLCRGIDCTPGAERLYGPDAGYACHVARIVAERTPICAVLKRFGGRPGVYVLDSGEALWAFVVAPGPDGRLYIDTHRAEKNADLLLKYAEGLAEELNLNVTHVGEV